MKKIKNSKLFRSLANNSFPKMVCLLLAIITWFIVMDNKNPLLETVYRDVPVELLGIEQVENRGLIIEQKSGDRVDVTVSGRWRDITKLREDSIHLSVSLDTIVGKGTNKLIIDRRVSASGVSIISLSSDSVELSIDAIETVNKPIRIQMEGSLAKDLELGTLVYKEDDIGVTGPSLILKEIAYLQGQLNLSEISISTTEHINILAYDIEGNVVEGVELETTSLAVGVPVIGTKTLPLEIITEGDIRTNYRLTEKVANPDKVTIKGNTNLLGSITEVRTKPVSIKNADKSFETMLEVELAKDIILVNTEPLSGKFTIEALDNKRFNIPGKDINLLGTDEKYSYTIDPELIIKLEIKDVRDAIKDIDEKDIKLETDLKGLGEGDYSLQISVKGIPETSLFSVSELPLLIEKKGD